MSCEINCQHVHLRKCPKAKYRKKLNQILKEGRKTRQVKDVAEASAQASDNVNDKADSICWFCHADVTHLESNKCAGCRKVTHPIADFEYQNIYFSRRATVTEGVRQQTGGDMETIAQKCKRRSRRRWRRRELNRK